jgi:superfamily II DNA or RNA helicase
MKIIAKHTSITISDYNIGDCDKLEKYLSIYDETKRRYIPYGFIYNEDKKELIVPRGVSLSYLEKLFNVPVEVSYDADPYETVSIKLQTKPKDDTQINAISFVLGEGKYSYTKKYSQLLINLPPGKGKTFISLASIALIGYKSLIITPYTKIKKQWLETFTTMSDLHASEICNINSSKVCEELLKKKNIKYKIYLVNHATIESFARTYGWNMVTELFQHLKIGIKVYDESHLCLGNILKIDSYTNTKKTIYLTATFNRSDPKEDKLMEKSFRNIVRFTPNNVQDTTDVKHTIYLSIHYKTHPTLNDKAAMFNYKGFNKSKYDYYESELSEFREALLYAVDVMITRVSGKVLVLGTNTKTLDMLRDLIAERYTDYTVSSYHSKLSKNEREHAFDADIICTTPLSSGTGLDLISLQGLIIYEAYSSKIEAEQLRGRLRPYFNTTGDMAKTIMIELVDDGVPKSKSMYMSRLPIFKKTCLKILKYKLY